ncbi:MAG TPA: hypothetical protein VFT31_15780 [Kribbella sp.]|nr:hypothetical protein [Kribbella sp.]
MWQQPLDQCSLATWTRAGTAAVVGDREDGEQVTTAIRIIAIPGLRNRARLAGRVSALAGSPFPEGTHAPDQAVPGSGVRVQGLFGAADPFGVPMRRRCAASRRDRRSTTRRGTSSVAAEQESERRRHSPRPQESPWGAPSD